MSAGEGTRKYAEIDVLGSKRYVIRHISMHCGMSKDATRRKVCIKTLVKVTASHNHDPAKTGNKPVASLNDYE